MIKTSILCRLALGWVLLVLFQYPAGADSPNGCSWPFWSAYTHRFMQSDGRIIDFHGENNVSTSEGQAYSLFFALVANDQESFKKILNWTQYNLANGDFGANLPAWQWGKQDGGKWGVLDSNSASDADLWMAYTLFQAASLWDKPEYQALGSIMLGKIKLQELASLPKLGQTLLPAPKGFVLPNNRWRLNTSYVPLQLGRYFVKQDPSGPWSKVMLSQAQMLKGATKNGYMPDWAIYDAKLGWINDETTAGVGSYDAIRVYLWLGMMDQADTTKASLIRQFYGMQASLAAKKPMIAERINAPAAEQFRNAPIGFYAALIPYADTANSKVQAGKLISMVKAKLNNGLLGDNPNYYDQVLGMFGLGWAEKRFSFDLDGNLQVAWKAHCISAAAADK